MPTQSGVAVRKVPQMQDRRPVMLVILDGWGWREDSTDNAVRQARTPSFDELWRSCPHAFLRTSGRDVGLPEGQMGNSEVGHLNIGAGRVVMQDLPRIDEAIRDGSLGENPELNRLIEALKQTLGVCHLLGLVSPGGVHAHQDHAVALAKLLTEAGVPMLMHAITDGRDTPPRSSSEYLQQLRAAMPPTVAIATVSGRYYAMDRDKRWERVEKAYRAIAKATGPRFPDAQAAIAQAYASGVSDEFIVPAVIGDYRGMQGEDGLLCFNFRADRTRQILTALLDPAFAAFPHGRALLRGGGRPDPIQRRARWVLRDVFPPVSLPNVLGQVVANAGRTQLRMAETEKYPHVTYFLNGGEETPYPGQERSWCRPPRSPPTTFSRRCPRPS